MLGSYSTVKKVAIKSLVECDDLWVEDLAVSARADAEYMVMVSHIELGTEVDEMPQECELCKLSSCYKELSTLTLKGGKTLILRDNSEIMVPKSERDNILQIAHQTHLGQEMMVHQLRGKVFWAGMNSDIREMVAKCDPASGTIDHILKKKSRLVTFPCLISGLATPSI